MQSDAVYKKIQKNYEKFLRQYWKGIDPLIIRPDFKSASIQYTNCRRELDQEFLKEYGIKEKIFVNPS